eukprot:m.8723 g.8723  ORF g.8723 m.8723 type:complete len:402 (+) comp6710_c0_seq2:141-1346(+)
MSSIIPTYTDEFHNVDANTHAANLRIFRGIAIEHISKEIGGSSTYAKQVLKEYMANFDFSGMGIVQAIRYMLHYFIFAGEAHETDRILEGFAHRYAECNPSFTPENTHVLATSIIMLNGDLYNKNNPRRMQQHEYIRNMEGTKNTNDEGENGENFSEKLLVQIYLDVYHTEILQGGTHRGHLDGRKRIVKDPAGINFGMVRSRRRSHHLLMASTVFSRHCGPLEPCSASGVFLRRKVSEPGGVKSKGNKQWDLRRLSLFGVRLLSHKLSTHLTLSVPSDCCFQLLRAFLVFHVYAELEHPRKHMFVFSIRHADGRVWFFKCNNEYRGPCCLALRAMFVADMPMTALLCSQRRTFPVGGGGVCARVCVRACVRVAVSVWSLYGDSVALSVSGGESACVGACR